MQGWKNAVVHSRRDQKLNARKHFLHFTLYAYKFSMAKLNRRY